MGRLQQTILLGIYLILLQIYDIIITDTVMSNGGSELNPTVNFFMDKFGVLLGLIIIKIIVVAIVAISVIYSICQNQGTKLIRNSFVIVAVLYTVAMIAITVMYSMQSI